jgi:hypothetical protein
MVTLPLSPTACALVVTMTLALTYFVGRFCGVKKVMDFIKKEIEENECKK